MNTIQEIEREDGRRVTSFHENFYVGASYFKRVYQEHDNLNIVDIIKLSYFFPMFIEDEKNEELIVVISKEELNSILDSFQKDKIIGPNGWTIEFYVDFYVNLLEDDLLKIVEEFENLSQDLGGQKYTFITLVPNKYFT